MAANKVTIFFMHLQFKSMNKVKDYFLIVISRYMKKALNISLDGIHTKRD
nr:MAG TPA: hypothetical protein [Caudoviricetes sp.]